VLEAGCGAAPFVIYFKCKGYEIDRVDFAEQIVEGLDSLYSDVNLFYGDYTNLSMIPDNAYDGYLSLGVRKHLEEAPDKFVKESYRILKCIGQAWITVLCIGDKGTPMTIKSDTKNPRVL
jgi:ubiquinone/menaquinone biosynthesis C-methylase UbiE